MELLDLKVPAKEWTLRLTSDWQVGSTTTSTKVIEKVMEPVYERSDYRVAFLGDLWDNISVKDKRHSDEDLDLRFPTERSQIRFVKSMIAPAAAKKRVLSLGLGNHELVSAQGGSGNATIDLAEDLGVPYGGYTAICRLNKMDEILLWHGRPSISSSLPTSQDRRMAIKRRLVRTNRARWPELVGRIKLFAQGHVNHLEVVSPEESLQMDMKVDWDREGGPEIDNHYRVSDPAWYAVCGSAQRLYVQGKVSYAEARGYAPIALGCVDAHFKGGRLVDVEAVHLG